MLSHNDGNKMNQADSVLQDQREGCGEERAPKNGLWNSFISFEIHFID